MSPIQPRQMYLVVCFLIICTLIPTNSTVEVSHSKKLEKGWPGLSKELTDYNRRRNVVTFPVTSLPNRDGGYIAHVRLGNPPKEFRLIVDSGSDVIWVPCTDCAGCPLVELSKERLFNPQQSSTASVIGCSDSRCAVADCSTNCSYNISYADGDNTVGYLVSDQLHINMIMESQRVVNYSVPIIFGCSTFLSGNLVFNEYIDGVLGLTTGSGLSIFSQLASAGLGPMVFSHCFGGTPEDGGSLVFGEVVEPGITYTNLYSSESRFNVYLRSIAVNGQRLHIDPSIFEISKTTGAIVDSGTPLTYIPEEAHNLILNAIYSWIKPSQVQHITIDSYPCFETNISIYEAFPMVTLIFIDASMELDPSHYLELYTTIDTINIWCFAWLKWQVGEEDRLTVLGDIVLKNKIIIYDLINKRMGWKNYNCSLPFNVSTEAIIGPIHNGHGGNKLWRLRKYAIPCAVLTLIVILILVGVVCRFRQ